MFTGSHVLIQECKAVSKAVSTRLMRELMSFLVELKTLLKAGIEYVAVLFLSIEHMLHDVLQYQTSVKKVQGNFLKLALARITSWMIATQLVQVSRCIG